MGRFTLAIIAVLAMAAATGATASKAVSRRQTPVFIAENCTQCMSCVAACPDTAMVAARTRMNMKQKAANKDHQTMGSPSENQGKMPCA